MCTGGRRMSQPVITLHTPSGATVELRAHCVGSRSINYSANVSINNTHVTYAGACTTHELDGKYLILDYAQIQLMDESVERAKAFFKDTADYINGGPA